MNATDLVTVGTAVTLLTQIVKRAGGGRWAKGTYVAPLLAMLCVGVWYVSLGSLTWPTAAWSVLADWIAVTATAMGLYSATQQVSPTAPADTRLAIRRRVLARAGAGPAATHMGSETAR